MTRTPPDDCHAGSTRRCRRRARSDRPMPAANRPAPTPPAPTGPSSVRLSTWSCHDRGRSQSAFSTPRNPRTLWAPRTTWAGRGLWLSALLLGLLVSVASSSAQEPDGGPGPVPIPAGEIQEIMNQPAAVETANGASQPTGIDLLTLVTRGGAFMIPIGLMSMLVVALAVERMLTLRRRRIVPRLLAAQLRELTDPIQDFDVTAAYEACLERPSPAARVIMAMVMRTGQPMADIERAAQETIDREADRLASPIRWLTLAAAATPLMGLLGTVWGMIVAFHESTTLTADRSRSEQLSEGIYTALVTTLAGLAVAIPAAMLALYLENRLIKLFHRVEQLAFDVAPALAQYCGRSRMNSAGELEPLASPAMPPPLENAAPAQPHTATGSSRSAAKRVS